MSVARTATVRARMSPELKESVEEVFSELGLTSSQAIVLFYKQIQLHKGLPFAVRLPHPPIPDMATMGGDEFDAELSKGYAAAMAGDVRPASEARAALHGKQASWTALS